MSCKQSGALCPWLMGWPGRRFLVVVLYFFGWVMPAGAQGGASFLHQQMGFPRVSAAWKKYNDSLGREFRRKGVDYPASDLYLRVFKSQNELEVWARNKDATEYRLVRTMRICALSGGLGPKRYKGDLQVPEGAYYIDSFNPQSNYHLSLKLSYPNYSDRTASGRDGGQDLGGDIFIHGGCVTIGCIPLMDEGIKQLYVICLNARASGQANIPVAVYPTRFNKAGVIYLKREYMGDDAKLEFWNELKEGYDYFEKYHRPLPVVYTPDGRYSY